MARAVPRAYSANMKSLRPLLTGVVGLALLVQGVVAAASPHLILARASAAAHAQSEMPCHNGKTAVPAQPCDCCDQDCADMSGCAFGHVAAIVPVTGLDFVASRQAGATTPDQAVASVFLPSHLRPPIVSRL